MPLQKANTYQGVIVRARLHLISIMNAANVLYLHCRYKVIVKGLSTREHGKISQVTYCYKPIK